MSTAWRPAFPVKTERPQTKTPGEGGRAFGLKQKTSDRIVGFSCGWAINKKSRASLFQQNRSLYIILLQRFRAAVKQLMQNHGLLQHRNRFMMQYIQHIKCLLA